MKKILLSCIALALSSSLSWAQKMPEYKSSGTITLTINDESGTFHSTSNTVPGQEGRMVHTANWRTFAPMMLGGINMAPPGVLVSISARPTIQPDSTKPELKITFSLDENDYSLLEDSPFEVVYTVREGPMAGEYKHVSGGLSIHSATLEGDTLQVNGVAEGVLAASEGSKGSGATLNYDADFVVRAAKH